MSNSDNSLMNISQASIAEERVHDITKERHALELRAEVINLVAGKKAERKGLSDRLEIGIESATDTAYGKEELHVGGGLSEEANIAETTGLMLSMTVYGKLNLNYYSDTLITAGGMLEQYTGGEVIAAGMSDNLLGGGGIRIRGADLRMNAASVVEEKVSTLAIDGLVAECCSTACEREEGNAIYSVGFASYKGTMEVLTGTTIRPMCRALFGVRTKNKGGGGGDNNDNEPAPKPPTTTLLPGDSTGNSVGNLASTVGTAKNTGRIEDVVTNADEAISTGHGAKASKHMDELQNTTSGSKLRLVDGDASPFRGHRLLPENTDKNQLLKTLNHTIDGFSDELADINKRLYLLTKGKMNDSKQAEKAAHINRSSILSNKMRIVGMASDAIKKGYNPIEILEEFKYEKIVKPRERLKGFIDHFTIFGPQFTHSQDIEKTIDLIDRNLKPYILDAAVDANTGATINIFPDDIRKNMLGYLDDNIKRTKIESKKFTDAGNNRIAEYHHVGIDNMTMNKDIEGIIKGMKSDSIYNNMPNQAIKKIAMDQYQFNIVTTLEKIMKEKSTLRKVKSVIEQGYDPIAYLKKLVDLAPDNKGEIFVKMTDDLKKYMITDEIQPNLVIETSSSTSGNYLHQTSNAYEDVGKIVIGDETTTINNTTTTSPVYTQPINNSDEATKAKDAEDAIQQSSRQGDNYDDTVMGADSNSAQKNITNSPEPIYAALDFSQNPVDSIQSNRPKTAYSDIKFDALSTPVEAYKDRSNLILRSNNQLGAGNVSPPSLKDIIQKNLNISSDQVKIKEGVSATDDVPSQQIAKLSTDKPSTFNTSLKEKEAGWIVSPASENVYLIPSPSRIEPEVPRPQSNSSFYGTGKTVSEDGYKSSSETFNLSGADDPFSNKSDPFSDSDSLSRIGSDNPSELADSNRPPQTPPPDYNSVVFESLDSNTGSSQTLTGSPLEETGRPVQNPGSPLINEPVPTNTRQTFKDHIGPVVPPDTASTSPVKPRDLPSNPLSIDNTQINRNLNSFESTKSNELLRMDVSDLDTSLTGGQNRTSTLDNGGFQKKELRTPGDRIEWAGNEDIINEPILLQRNKEMYEQISSGAMTPQFYSKPSSKYKPKFHSKPLFEYNPKFRKNSFFNKGGNAQLPSQLDVRAPKLNKPKRKTFIDEFRKKPARAEITNLSDATNTSLSKNTTDIGSVTDIRQLDAALDLKPTKRPPIETPEQLEDFVRSTYGKNVGDTTKSSSKLKRYDVYEYSGIVYRGDGRAPIKLNQVPGFESKNNLNIRKNRIEATGLGKSKGATGQSGVSTSKYIEGAIGYSNGGIRDHETGFVYIIDTDLLPKNNKYKAYDMGEILRNNGLKQIDESGGEVNITEIPMEAIIGWIRITSGGDVGKAVSNGEDLFSDNIRPLLEFIVKKGNPETDGLVPGFDVDGWLRESVKGTGLEELHFMQY